MAKSIDDFIKDKGIIKCVNHAKEIYYLDIEEHHLYAEKEIITLMEVKNESKL